MNREEYIEALTFCLRVETAGAIAGEVAMLLRENADEKRKLDLFRRIEASNKVLCRRALKREGVDRTNIDRAYYRGGYKIGLRLGEGDWGEFLDRFEATVHPEEFTRFVTDEEGQEIVHEYDAVDVPLLRHLVRHEESFATFVALEREGRGGDSTREMENVLNDETCCDLVGAHDPVGW